MADLKATNWSITAFNEEMNMLESIRKGEDKYKLPYWVRELAGGLEKCKKTGTMHFQGHIFCRGQQRQATLKKWLPTTHLEVDRNKFAAKQYTLKSDTAQGEKTVVENELEYVDNEGILRLLARTAPKNHWAGERHTTANADLDKYDFWKRVNMIIREKPYLIGLLAKPDTYRAWKHTSESWFFLEKALPNYSITQSSSSKNEIILSPENINAQVGEIVFADFGTSEQHARGVAPPLSQEEGAPAQGSGEAPGSPQAARSAQGSPDSPDYAWTSYAV